MKRASCGSPEKCVTVNKSAKSYSEQPDLSLVAEETDPSYPEKETPESRSRPAVGYDTVITNPNSPLKQVGLARVHVEILILSDEFRHSRRDHDENIDDSLDETGNEGLEDDDCDSRAQESGGSPEGVPTTTTAAIDTTTRAQTSFPANHSLSPRRRNWTQREGEDDGDDENNRPRKRPRRNARGVDPPRGRFACPYQAYEPWRNCFKPSQRNPRGGCDNISRLKDHLTRKHMPSYRCQRCWKHFNARQKVAEHQQGDCVEQEPPVYEIFMTLEQETEVDNCGGMQPEDTWWKLFQLLIPGMDIEDLAQLKGRYFPYYADMSFSIPSLNFSNIFFDNTPTPFPGQTNGNETAPVSLASPSSALPGFGDTALTSQSFSVPIYATTGPQPPPIPSIESSVADVMPLSVAPQSSEFDSTTPRDIINMSSTPASSQTMAPSSVSDTSQIRRNYDRLKMRASQADAENGELRETINSTREEVRSAGALLEEVLGMENLEGEVYERVSRAAEILIGATGRLR